MANFLKLRISGEKLPVDLLRRTFVGEDCSVCLRGNHYYDRVEKREKMMEQDVFLVTAEYAQEMPFHEAVSDFVKLLVPNRQIISQMTKTSQVMLWASLYPENRHFNVALLPETLSILSQLGVELHIETTFLGE